MAKKYSAFGILYIERDRFLYYLADREQPITLQLDLDILKDLEVVSVSSLERQLQNWFEAQKISPIQTVIILSDQVYFSQEFEGVQIDDKNAQVTEYVELIPFNQKHLLLLPSGQNTNVVVINDQLLFPIIETFKKLNFQVFAALPIALLQIDLAKITPSDFVNLLATHLEGLLIHNFLRDTNYLQQPDEKKAFYSFKFNRKVITLLVVFSLLIGILGMLILNQKP